jgi:hypothetical protein
MGRHRPPLPNFLPDGMNMDMRATMISLYSMRSTSDRAVRASRIGRIILLILLASSPLLRAQTPRPFSFFAIGDGGEPGGQLQANARQMDAIAAADSAAGAPIGLMIVLGDNFYPNGLNLKPPERAKMIADVLGPMEPMMRSLGPENVHSVTGNHDYYCAAISNIPYGVCTDGVEFEQQISSWTFHKIYPASIRRALVEGGKDSVEIIFVDSSLLLVAKPEKWRPILDSLEHLLRISAAAPGVTWRVLALHHSPYSVGDHAGYRRWDRKNKRIVYIGNCIEEGDDPFRYVQQFVSNQDNCTPRYRAYSDSLMSTIRRAGADIQVLLAGHDHSLQLLNYPEKGEGAAPGIFVISGAGSKAATVKSPTPKREYTHPINTDKEKGKSAFGFVKGRFEGDRLVLTYYDGSTGAPLDMGGASTFVIDRSGALVETR